MKKSKFKTLKTIRGLLLLSLIGFACICDAEEQIDIDVDMLNIIEMPQKYDGKSIKTKGWISMRFEDVNIWVTWQDHENRNRKRCISLANRFRDPEKRKEIDGKYVELIGTFQKDIRIGSDGTRHILPTGCNEMAITFNTEKVKVIQP